MGYNRAEMSSQVFYRKWRPQSLSEVVGQEHITQTLRHAVDKGRIAHAYLFCAEAHEPLQDTVFALAPIIPANHQLDKKLAAGYNSQNRANPVQFGPRACRVKGYAVNGD